MGTDPNALIQQPYTYPKPTGGFIHVRSADGGLTVRFLDDHGVVLHEVNKPGK